MSALGTAGKLIIEIDGRFHFFQWGFTMQEKATMYGMNGKVEVGVCKHVLLPR